MESMVLAARAIRLRIAGSHTPSSLQERPFKILGLQQVAIGGLEKKALARLWSDTLGVEKVGSYESKKENVREDILKLGHGVNAVEIDLMEPLDPTIPPRVQTPALNHIGLWVHPLPECVEWLTRQGMRFTPGGIRQGASGHDVAFIHPKGDVNFPLSGEGVLIELVQAPPDIVANAERQ
ncbi:Lactoylglutathione lyase, putative [Ectocarpus siliculosus]|uniref:Lactoylglutathione lyase, putative n=1 Tax=Ectocarpus siliculosus TaxID=2880 RepID=D8LH79_ECTSI|nr:Lactoylglutathione lyase, putative [Ectocarpus siliculosus]|eukprot:CBN74298.1 Lactoylglutathione lyase, putative [Ectocarpus siliculosus]